MKPTIIIGIDPGLDGGIAEIGAKGSVFVEPMPTEKRGNKRVLRLDLVMLHLESRGDDYEEWAYIEKAQAMPSQGGVSMFNYGVGYGQLLMAIHSQDYHYEEIPPKRWQKHFGISGKKGCTKAQSIAIAKELFPDVNLFRTPRCKKEHDGMADSLLIAEYGRQTL